MPTLPKMPILAIVLAAGLLLAAAPQPVLAQAAASCQQVRQYIDLDADGQPEAMVLDCQFAENTSDQVTIYKGSGKISTGIPWPQNIQYEDETWVFDHGAKGKASLIIRFTREGAALTAELYDDRSGDGEVGYELQNGKVNVTENRFWTVRVVAPEGWWIREGGLNYNLHFQVDGDVEGMFTTLVYRSQMVTDGKPDYDIQIYDRNNNGKPEFDKRMILTPFLLESNALGTQMMANWEDDELPISGGFSLWPYLDLVHASAGGSRIVKGYRQSPPPIQFEPASGRIEALGEFVASRGGEHNCFYYTGKRWKAGQLNETDFESPFCFYDLAEDSDGIPELQVRAVYWPPYDRTFLQGSVAGAYELIRYSWDQENTQTWRYAVGLVGQHPIDSQVAFADIDVLTIPYTQFPTWVSDHAWDMAVFSEFTGEQYFTSEGNYTVSYPEDDRFAEYFTGKSDSMPSPVFEPEVNFKMEWAMNYQKRPTFYFSPLDHRLHLLGAAGGSWKLDDRHSIQYNNLDEGDVINQWIYEVEGQPEKSMTVLKDIVILNENDRIILRFTEVPESQFITSLPYDHEVWNKLGFDLEQHKPTFAPDDFKAMQAQFGGEELALNGAALRDFRLVPGGFRFVLALKEGFSVEGRDELGLKNTPPGEYVVSYDGAFHLQALTPPALRFDLSALPQPGNLPAVYGTYGLRVGVRNDGLEDAQQVRVTLGTAAPGQAVEWAEPQTIRVLAGETASVSLPWNPQVSGDWQVRVQAQQLEGESAGETITAGEVVEVQPPPTATFGQELTAFGLVASWQVALLLAALALAAGLTAWALLRAVKIENRDE